VRGPEAIREKPREYKIEATPPKSGQVFPGREGGRKKGRHQVEVCLPYVKGGGEPAFFSFSEERKGKEKTALHPSWEIVHGVRGEERGDSPRTISSWVQKTQAKRQRLLVAPLPRVFFRRKKNKKAALALLLRGTLTQPPGEKKSIGLFFPCLSEYKRV